MSDELYHFGIKGMKWGVRRTPQQLGHDVRRRAKARYRTAVRAEKKRFEKRGEYVSKHPGAPMLKGVANTIKSAPKVVAKTVAGGAALQLGGIMARQYVASLGAKPAKSLYIGSKASIALGSALIMSANFDAIKPIADEVYDYASGIAYRRNHKRT